MKLIRFGALTAILAGTALIGCSSESPTPGDKDASVGFKLLASGVDIDSVSWDLNTQGGADVADDSIPVPNDNSTISLEVQSLSAGAYSLAFSATGTYLATGETVQCTAAPVLFTLAPSQQLALPLVTLTCEVSVNVPDATGGITADVEVVVEQIPVDNNIVQVFSAGPRSVAGVSQPDDTCAWPPIAVKVHSPDPTIAYGWSSDTGSFSLNPTQTQGTFNCDEIGPAELTLTATLGTIVASKSITVQCNPGNCVDTCGDGTVQPGEECDEATPRCTDCQITPVCGDGITDAPEQCDDAGPSATCTATCEFVPPPTCGNGTLEPTLGEECDDGNTTGGDGCTNCLIDPFCGDGTVDPGEECDDGNTTGGDGCTACTIDPFCGDGTVDPGEECDDGNTTGGDGCEADCSLPPSSTFTATCEPCIEASADLGPFQQTYCVDAYPAGECLDLEQCFVDTGCYLPVPAACYCGPDTSANCEQDSFVPTGDCAGLIRAATGNVSNAETLTRAVQLDNPSGVAWTIIGEAANQCGTACFP